MLTVPAGSSRGVWRWVQQNVRGATAKVPCTVGSVAEFGYRGYLPYRRVERASCPAARSPAVEMNCT